MTLRIQTRNISMLGHFASLIFFEVPLSLIRTESSKSSPFDYLLGKRPKGGSAPSIYNLCLANPWDSLVTIQISRVAAKHPTDIPQKGWT